MNQEDGGRPHVHIGKLPEPDEKVDSLWVLVAINPDGGEGVYGQLVGDFWVNFAVADDETKEVLEQHLRSAGSVEVCKRDGIRLEWRRFERCFQAGIHTEELI
jgi:hypothetical protein